MNKKTAKKYLLSVLILFTVTAIISALIIFGISASGNSNLDLSIQQSILLSLACAVIPSGSFTGFAFVFLNIKQITKFWKIALCVLFPVTLAVINIFGIIALMPSIIYSIIVIVKHNSKRDC
ncbi:MAG: hypothetical protein ACLUFN_03910 [Eubacterium sp.]